MSVKTEAEQRQTPERIFLCHFGTLVTGVAFGVAGGQARILLFRQKGGDPLQGRFTTRQARGNCCNIAVTLIVRGVGILRFRKSFDNISVLFEKEEPCR